MQFSVAPFHGLSTIPSYTSLSSAAHSPVIFNTACNNNDVIIGTSKSLSIRIVCLLHFRYSKAGCIHLTALDGEGRTLALYAIEKQSASCLKVSIISHHNNYVNIISP